MKIISSTRERQKFGAPGSAVGRERNLEDRWVGWIMDYHEAVGGPEVDEWSEAVQGREVVRESTPMREQDDG